MGHLFRADTVLVGTGSSNIWIGASKSYAKTSTSENTGGQFVSPTCYSQLIHNCNCNCFQSISYVDSIAVFGEEYLDTVTLNSDLVTKGQSIGVAEFVSVGRLGERFDGILGLGPVDLTEGTVSNTNEVPTVMDNLYAQRTISSEVLGVFFSPSSSGDSTDELTFGGYDASKITREVSYMPIISTYPSSRSWGIGQSISYGGTVILSNTAGIVDTGTTLILIGIYTTTT